MFSNDQQFQIEKTNAHLLSYCLSILIKDHQHTVKPRLSGLVVGGQKWYKNYGPSNPKINACQDPAEKTIETKLPSFAKWTGR